MYVEACTKPVLCDGNYDYENNDYANALRPRGPRRFKRCDFSTNLACMILLHMLDTFNLSSFS